MLLALTVMMTLATVIGASVDLILIRWHYQDRRRMAADEIAMADRFTADEEAAQIRFETDEAEILRLKNERHETPS